MSKLLENYMKGQLKNAQNEEFVPVEPKHTDYSSGEESKEKLSIAQTKTQAEKDKTLDILQSM
jgi:hypothetical protein